MKSSNGYYNELKKLSKAQKEFLVDCAITPKYAVDYHRPVKKLKAAKLIADENGNNVWKPTALGFLIARHIG